MVKRSKGGGPISTLSERAAAGKRCAPVFPPQGPPAAAGWRSTLFRDEADASSHPVADRKDRSDEGALGWRDQVRNLGTHIELTSMMPAVI